MRTDDMARFQLGALPCRVVANCAGHKSACDRHGPADLWDRWDTEVEIVRQVR